MRSPIITNVYKFIVVLPLLIGQAANSDVLVLKNGDRITGDIKRIWDNEITIEPIAVP